MKKSFFTKRIFFAGAFFAVLILVSAAATYFWSEKDTAETFPARFVQAYNVYLQAAKEHEDAVRLLASSANDHLRKANLSLTTSLASGVDGATRERVSKEGLENLAEIEKQIDIVGERAVFADSAISDMKIIAENIEDDEMRDIAFDIVFLAREKYENISDIRGLSYRANSETEDIFKRIIKDGGELTGEHSSVLNEMLPEIEKRYDEKMDFYNGLSELDRQIGEKYEIFKNNL